MRQFTTIAIVGCLLWGPCGTPASADGGRLVLVQQKGDYRFSVFTSPEPLRAGPIDVSVLLQDAETGRSIADAQVIVRLKQRSGKGRILLAHATTAAATNKLLRAAVVELPDPGTWNVEIDCIADHGPAQVSFAIEAGQKLPRWLTVWPWFCWPAGVVLLFAIHRVLVRRKQAEFPRASYSIT